MATPEHHRAFPSHIPFQHPRFGFPKIDYDEAIEHIGKFPIDVESQ